jgi:DNA-binding PadR family transcriptional regulator
MTQKYLSRSEELVLLAVLKLEDDAYGVGIRRLLQEMTGKYWSVGSVYVPLERLEKQGFLASNFSSPRPERGGRRKRLFRVTPSGLRELDELHRVFSKLWMSYPKLKIDDSAGT